MSQIALELKIKALVEGLNNVTQLATELRGTGTAAKDAGSNATSGATGFDGLKNKIGGAGSGAKEMDGIVGGSLNPTLSLLKDNVGKLVGAFTALALAYGLKESADYAARTEVLGTTLGVVAKNAGYGATEIAGYEKEVKGLGITTQATRQALTQMIQAGLEIGPAAAGQVSQVAKLARAAQDLAVVTGENSSATLNRLITNIQQMDTEGLRYMGLTVNIQQAQDKFALSLGKTSEELTQQQKIQAVANAALAQAATLTGAYEASMQNVGKQLQSIKRYQDELANDIGNKLLPAYYQLVVAATDFLKVADEIVVGVDSNGNSARNLAEGVKEFFGGLKDLGLAVIQLLAEITPAFIELTSQVLNFSGDVLEGIAGILGFASAIDAAGQKTTGFGQILRVIIETFSFMVAGFRDGLDFINMGVAELGGEFQILVGTMIKGWGLLLSYISKDTGAAVQKAGESMIAVGIRMRAFAADTATNFANGSTHVGKLNAALEQTKAISTALAKATGFNEVEEQIRKLVEAKRKSSLTDVELKKGSDEVAIAIKRLGVEVDATTGKTRLSEEQVRKLGTALLNVTKDSAQQFSEAINDMGLKLIKLGGVEYLTPLSKEFDKLSGDVLKLADNATTTSLQFREAFSNGLDSAKTLADIDKISDSLVNAKNAGKDVADAATEINSKFEEVFATALKAARTKDDFARLTAELRQMGDKGEISAKLIDKAMADLQERIKGTRAETALLAQQTTDLGRSNLTVAQAHLGVVRADYEVGHARLDVWKAQNKYSRDGTDLSQQELKLAQLNLQLAQAKAGEARLAYAEAQQSAKVVLATQEEILAVIRLQRDPNNEALILAREAAKIKLEGETAAYEVAKQRAEKQQEIVLKTEEEVYKQKELVEQAKAVEEETQKIKNNMQGTADATGRAAQNMSNLGNNSRNSGSSSGSNNRSGSGGASGGSDASKKNGSQSRDGRITVMGDPNQSNTPTDVQDFVKNGAKNSNFTDKDNVTWSKNSQGQMGNNATPTGSTQVSAEENRYWDFKEGKISKADAKDTEYIKGIWSAAQANLETAQQVGGEYLVSAKKSWNFARRAMESLGLSTTFGGSAGFNDGSGDTGGFGGFGSGNGGFGNFGGNQVNANSLLQQVQYQSSPLPQVNPNQAAKSSKTIQVNFTNDSGKVVPMTIDASNEQTLLDLLKRAKGVST
ncbi:MAG: hypothetical protein Q7T62_18035 [Undibacterium sp.]|nr:hypothetical protein [Undibacterium sp.]